ncbi:class I SAM-dependent methyltransferase [Mycobacterium sp. CSUR Q5927]|nr:class I SAM-dependent methyltransferase [Mycobacterium sp. CSUR Q5927]
MIKVDGIKTYSNAEALGALEKCATSVPADRAIVEVGVFRGGSLRTIAKVARTTHIYGVDAWGLEGSYASKSESATKYGGLDTMAVAQRAVSGLNVELIRGFSTEVAATYDGPPIGLLYIDAEHTFDAVTADFHAWHPRLADDAHIAFDDYTETFPGMIDGIDMIVAEYNLAPIGVHGGRLAVTHR